MLNFLRKFSEGVRKLATEIREEDKKAKIHGEEINAAVLFVLRDVTGPMSLQSVRNAVNTKFKFPISIEATEKAVKTIRGRGIKISRVSAGNDIFFELE